VTSVQDMVCRVRRLGPRLFLPELFLQPHAPPLVRAQGILQRPLALVVSVGHKVQGLEVRVKDLGFKIED